MRPLGELQQIRAAIAPALAAVEGPHHAADLDRGVDLVGMGRIGRHPDDARRETHRHALGLLRIREPAPGIAAVFALVHGGRRRAEIHDLRIAGMEQKRPHDLALVGEAEPFPVRPAIGAAIRPVLGPDEDDVRIVGMHRDRPDLPALGQPAGQRLPGIVADRAVEAGLHAFRRVLGPLRCTRVHVRSSIGGHGEVSFVTFRSRLRYEAL